jgi:hypothetical protein
MPLLQSSLSSNLARGNNQPNDYCFDNLNDLNGVVVRNADC